MRNIKSLGLAAFAAALTVTTLHADQWDKKTVVTFDAPVQIPTATLQAGTYTLKLLDSMSNRHIVTVWDRDGMHLVTTVLAIPNYRLQPTGKSVFTFWETPADQPPALRAWFYPGDNFGQEFAYPKWKAQQLAKVTRADVPSLADNEARFGTRPAEPAPAPPQETAAVVPARAPVEPAPAPPVEATPEPAPAPAPEPPAPEPPQQPAEAAKPAMPPTAGIWAQLVLVGLLAAIGGFALSGKRRNA